jgi:formylglycine-generating enzyme required for sulfatase activity
MESQRARRAEKMPIKKTYDFNDSLDCLRSLSAELASVYTVGQCSALLALLPENLRQQGVPANLQARAFMLLLREVVKRCRNVIEGEVKWPPADVDAAHFSMAVAASIGLAEQRNYDGPNRPIPSTEVRQGNAASWLPQGERSAKQYKREEPRALHAFLDAIQTVATDVTLMRGIATQLGIDGGSRTSSGDREKAPGLVGRFPDDILRERSLLHVLRTLEARKEYASAHHAVKIEEGIAQYNEWHSSGSQNADPILHRIDSLCRDYLGDTLHNLTGRIEIAGKGPDYAPHEPLPFCQYPVPDAAMILIPGGVDPFTGETVAPYFMATYPVTAYEWYGFLTRFTKDGWPASKTWNQYFPGTRWLGHPELPRLPAVGMTFYDCLMYCFWLWYHTPYRFRLPTEAEWNFAATGGQRRRFPWGDEPNTKFDRYTIFDIPQVPAPVDELPMVAEYGISGMSGNIWEYTSTLSRGTEPITNSDAPIPDLAFALAHERWWSADSRIPKKDHAKKESWREIVKFVIKGGSYTMTPKDCEVARRAFSSFYILGAFCGFRLVASACKDPETGQWIPEPSPFINPQIRQVRAMSSADFAGEPEQWSMPLGGCEVASAGPITELTPPDADSPWAELLRRRNQ